MNEMNISRHAIMYFRFSWNGATDSCNHFEKETEKEKESEIQICCEYYFLFNAMKNGFIILNLS